MEPNVLREGQEARDVQEQGLHRECGSAAIVSQVHAKEPAKVSPHSSLKMVQ